MRKRSLLLAMLVMTSIILCACGSKAETEEKETTAYVEEQQSSTAEEATTEEATTKETTTEEATTEEATTEEVTTEEETTAPKITQCQDIKDTTYVDIFTLEGIDGPTPKENSSVGVFTYYMPTVCKWDKDAKAFIAENNGNNENNEYFVMHVDAGHVADDDTYEKGLSNFQAKLLEDEANGYTCRLAYNDEQNNLAYYSMKKEYETIDGEEFVKYNICIAYYHYNVQGHLYKNFYAVFDYEITKPLSIENIEDTVEYYYGTRMYEYNVCVIYGLMPK